jgi:hypothetical protein
MARQIGCPIHGGRLVCPSCDVELDLNEREEVELERLLKTLGASDDSGPTDRPCPHCGAGWMCLRCDHYRNARLSWSRLTVPEQERRAVLRSRVRLKDRGARH